MPKMVMESVARGQQCMSSSPSSRNTKTRGTCDRAVVRCSASPTRPQDLEMLQVVGSGSFGKVWKARDRRTSQLFAVKKARKKDPYLRTECTILSKLQHPNIVNWHFHFSDSCAMYLGMELCTGGDVYTKIRNSPNGRLSSDESACFFAQVCDAVIYLHAQHVIHRDLKPENLLLTAGGRIKIIDFGWSRVLRGPADSRKTLCGTAEYCAPEMVSGKGHNEKVDLWGLGV